MDICYLESSKSLRNKVLKSYYIPIIKPQAVSKTRVNFFAACRLSTPKSSLVNKCTFFQL